jgi:hypothetical protein
VSWYSIALFLHIAGALGLFAGISLEQASLRGLRRATSTGSVREWLGVLRSRRRVEGPAGLTLLVTGVFMVHVSGGMQPWIGLGLLGMVLIALVGAFGTGRAAGALLAALPADDRPIPWELRRRIGGTTLRSAAALRMALALGVVFDMAVKPDAPAAYLALGGWILAGALAPWLGGRGALPAREYGAEH